MDDAGRQAKVGWIETGVHFDLMRSWQIIPVLSAGKDHTWLDGQDYLTNYLVMNKAVTLAEAKAHLSALITEAEEGAEITITRHGRPVARVIGAPQEAIRTAGDWGWRGTYDKSVFAPMTDEQIREEGWPA
jgi:prevent-host-death family protein